MRDDVPFDNPQIFGGREVFKRFNKHSELLNQRVVGFPCGIPDELSSVDSLHIGTTKIDGEEKEIRVLRQTQKNVVHSGEIRIF